MRKSVPHILENPFIHCLHCMSMGGWEEQYQTTGCKGRVHLRHFASLPQGKHIGMNNLIHSHALVANLKSSLSLMCMYLE